MEFWNKKNWRANKKTSNGFKVRESGRRTVGQSCNKHAQVRDGKLKKWMERAKKKKEKKERKGEGEEISGTWMPEQKIQRVCKWETPRWFSIGNLILALTIPINGEYYPFRFRITKLPTIRFVFVHRLVIKVYTRGGVQFREQSSDLTWLVEEAGEYYIHYFFFLFSLSLSFSFSLSLSLDSRAIRWQ